MLLAGAADHITHLGDHRIQPFRLQMTEVQGHAYFAWNHIARARIRLQTADSATGMRLMFQGHTIDRRHHRTGANQGVFSQVHRRRPGVRLDTAQGQVKPLLAKGAKDHADGLVLILQDWSLLDMRFEIRPHRVTTDRPRPGIADGVERLADADALGVGLGQGFFQGKFLCEHPRAHHARGKARAFLVGPDHHLQRRLGFDLQVIEGAHDFQPGQHPKAAIELAAGGLGVDMAAGHHRRQLRVAARTAGENVTDAVDGHRTTGLLGPFDEQVAGLAIKVGQRQAAHPAFDRGAEPGQVHQRLPQAFAVDMPMGRLQNVLCCLHAVLLHLLPGLCGP
ncbi:hypothetical protein D3C77_345670 [compost metagenome]